MSPEITRFAPSPTGYLHLGHAYAALFAAQIAETTKGRFLLRIEDTDHGRCKASFEEAIYEDLSWLGITWEQPVRRQSEHADVHSRAMDALKRLGCVYPCFCTRKDIELEFAASVGAPQGPDGPIYPGTCKWLSETERSARIARGVSHAWRLDVAKALRVVDRALSFHESGGGPDGDVGVIVVQPHIYGDFVLARKDAAVSYHLAVAVDDAAQGVTLVTRGRDLFPATHLHRLLQCLLGLPEIRYRHHRLIVDDQGRRLAKRDQATSLRQLRAQGVTVAQIYERLGLPVVQSKE